MQEYYKLPKILFDKNSKYKDISLSAKITYCILADAILLHSTFFKWVFPDNSLYLECAREETKEILHFSVNTITKVFKELHDIGLLYEETSSESGKSNKTFLMNLETNRLFHISDIS